MRLGPSHVALAALSLCALSNCLDPTEIVLEIGTDVACSEVRGVAVAVGAPGVDDVSYATVTSDCSSDGGIGSLVVTPSGAGDAVGIRVVMGIDASAEQCEAPSYAGCIVARREISFIPHMPLRLPIDLQASCIGVACTPNSTCVSGGCVDAGVGECTSGVCTLPDAGPPPPPPPCTDVRDAVLTTSTTFQQTPRIARMNGGYAILWELPSSQVIVMLIDESGHTLKTFQLAYIGSAGRVDGVGSDGANVVGVWEGPNADGGTTLFALGSAPDGGISTSSYGGATGPLTGVLWDGVAQAYVVGGVTQGLPSLFEFPSASLVGSVNLAAGAVSGVTVSGDHSAYDVSFVAGAGCYVYRCAPASGIAYACGTIVDGQGNSCTGVRTAVSGNVTYVGTFFNGSVTLQQFGANPPPASIVAQADNGTAFALLATGQAPIHIVTRLGSALSSNTLPTKQPSPTAIATTSYTGTAAGFDAVADGPNAPSFGVVYIGQQQTLPAVMFAHVCE